MNSENEETICVKCNKSFTWYDALYCPYCGFSIFNTCTNPECNMCVENPDYDENTSLKWNYKFCPDCGSKSTFHDYLTDEDLSE